MSLTSRYRDNAFYQLVRAGDHAQIEKNLTTESYRRSKAITYLFLHILNHHVQDLLAYKKTLWILIQRGPHRYRRTKATITAIRDFINSPLFGKRTQHFHWLRLIRPINQKIHDYIIEHPRYKYRSVNTLLQHNFLHRDLLRQVATLL